MSQSVIVLGKTGIGVSMNNESYLLYINGNIDEFSSKINKFLLQRFVKDGLALDTDQLSLTSIAANGVDVSKLNGEGNKIKHCLENNDAAVKEYETIEFTKDFKYSVLFTCEEFDNLVKWAESLSPAFEKDDETTTRLDDFQKPILYKCGDLYLIKLRLYFSAVDPLTVKELMSKYVIIVALHLTERLVEFRFDSIRRIFLDDSQQNSIYTDIITNLRNYLQKSATCTLRALNLDFMREEAEQGRSKGIVTIGQYRRLINGGNAQLEVGKNSNYVLPIIGDLKEIIEKYQCELEKVPEFKQALQDFLYENDELADYNWIEVMWENEIKTRQVSVKFTFRYRDSDFCLIQHYYNHVLVGMERMNNVVKYINENRRTHQ